MEKMIFFPACLVFPSLMLQGAECATENGFIIIIIEA